jgi:hypothetical protein
MSGDEHPPMHSKAASYEPTNFSDLGGAAACPGDIREIELRGQWIHLTFARRCS